MSVPTLPFSQRPVQSSRTLLPVQLEEKLLLGAERVFSDWAQLTPRRLGAAADRPESDQLLAAVDLEGPRQGLLSVSCQQRFAAMLAVAATGDGNASDFGREALLELTQRLRETLLVDGLGQDGRDHLLQAARLAAPEELPTAAPTTALRLQVNGYPVSLRLWLR